MNSAMLVFFPASGGPLVFGLVSEYCSADQNHQADRRRHRDENDDEQLMQDGSRVPSAEK